MQTRTIALGLCCASDVRSDDEALSTLARDLGTSVVELARRLADVHGRTLVHNALADIWPEDIPNDLKELGGCSVADLRNDDEALSTLSASLRSSIQVLRERLQGVHGRALVRNALSDLWPTGVSYSLDDLGNWSVADLRDNDNVMAALSARLDKSVATLAKRLEDVHGRTLVRNALSDLWPADVSYTLDDLAEWSVADLRADDNAMAALSAGLGTSVATLAKRLGDVHGRTLVSNALSNLRPADVSYTLDDLAEWSVADLRADDNAMAALSAGLGTSVATLAKRLEDVHGRTLLRSILGTLKATPARSQRNGGRPSRSEADSNARLVQGQGRNEHRSLQDRLVELGILRSLGAFADRGYDIRGIVRKPDVTWCRQQAGGPCYAFEIEFGGKPQISKSWETLEKLHEAFNCVPVLFVPRSSMALAAAVRPLSLPGSALILAVEDCSGVRPVQLAKLLGLVRIGD